jgi:uncharacterized protein YodC (DUF2158 family)
MLREGDMARAGSGRLMKISTITNDVAECVWFDNRGAVHTRDFDVDSLKPFWLSATPRSLWPEINDMPDQLVAAMDAAADAKRKAKATKARMSNKLKRRVAA